MINSEDIITTIRKGIHGPVSVYWHDENLEKEDCAAREGEVWHVTLTDKVDEDGSALKEMFGAGTLYHFPVKSVDEGLSLFYDIDFIYAGEGQVILKQGLMPVRSDKPLFLLIHTNKE